MKFFKFDTECNGSVEEVISWLNRIHSGFGNVEMTFTAHFNPELPLRETNLIAVARDAYRQRGKIQAIRAVREESSKLTPGVGGMGLQEAKDYVEEHWEEIAGEPHHVYMNRLMKR